MPSQRAPTVVAKNTTSTIIPCMTYRDAARAIEWLCDTFGFEKQAVYAGQNDTIEHAQLTFGNGMIMCGSTSRMRCAVDLPIGEQYNAIWQEEEPLCYMPKTSRHCWVVIEF